MSRGEFIIPDWEMIFSKHYCGFSYRKEEGIPNSGEWTIPAMTARVCVCVSCEHMFTPWGTRNMDLAVNCIALGSCMKPERDWPLYEQWE